VGDPRAGADRPAPGAQARPLLVAVDEHPALVEDSVQEKGGAFLDPVQPGEVERTIGDGPKAGDQIGLDGAIMAHRRDQQIQVGVRILVSAGNGAVEDREPNASLGAQGLAKARQQGPVLPQILTLARGETQATGARPVSSQGSLGSGPPQRALLGAEVEGQFLYRSHVGGS
jgi:hypothetical protein